MLGIILVFFAQLQTIPGNITYIFDYIVFKFLVLKCLQYEQLRYQTSVS